MGGSRDFAGADYIDFGTSSIFSGESGFSAMCWVNLDSIGTNEYFVTKWNSSEKPLLLGIDNTGKFIISIGKGNNTTQTVEATDSNLSTLMSTTTWTHLCGVNDLPSSANADLFIDGTSTASSIIFDNASASTISSNTADYFMGSLSTPASYMNGRMAQVGVYSGILTTDQINELMYHPWSWIPISQIPIYGADSPEPDLGTGNTGTVTNTTESFDGPPIFLLGGQ